MSEQNAQEIVGTLINVEKVVVSGKPQSGDQDARWEHAVCRPAEGGITGAHTVHILTLLKERGRHMEDSHEVYAAVFVEVVTDSSRPSDIALALLCRSGGKVNQGQTMVIERDECIHEPCSPRRRSRSAGSARFMAATAFPGPARSTGVRERRWTGSASARPRAGGKARRVR